MQSPNSRKGRLACLTLSLMLVASPFTVLSAPDAASLPAGATLGPPNDADSEALKNKVAADKAAVDQALNDIDAAFNNYIAAQQANIKDATAKGKPLTPAQSLLNEPDAPNKRKPVFAANLQKIKQLNEKSGEFLAHGINEFTALTEKEFADLYLTTFPSSTDPPRNENAGRKLQQTRTCYSSKTFPFGSITPSTTGVDWRSAGHITPVRNQGQCGSCAAFAATAVAEATYIAKNAASGATNSNTNLSEQDLLTCITGDQCQGAWPDYYLDRMTCRGILTEAQKPYTANDDNNCLSTTRTSVGMVNWSKVPKGQTAYKQALMHGPMAIGIQGGPLQSYTSGIWDCGALTSSINHAVTAVGYQNSVLMSNGARWNIMMIKNSWGSSWGSGGYTYVRLDCSTTGRGSLAVWDYAVVGIKG